VKLPLDDEQHGQAHAFSVAHINTFKRRAGTALDTWKQNPSNKADLEAHQRAKAIE